MSEIDQPEPEYWEEQLNKLQIMIDSADENGLFEDHPEDYKTLIDEIADAISGLSEKPPKTIEARKKYSCAISAFNRHVNSKQFSWRFDYCYGGPALLYLLSVFSAILLVWFFFWPSLLDYNILWVPSWTFLWGAMGGVLNGFWKLWQHVSARGIRKVWYTWYIVLPLMGAILGALTYLILLAGLIATTGQSQVQSQFLLMLLSGLAGFSARWAVELLEKLTQMIQIKA